MSPYLRADTPATAEQAPKITQDGSKPPRGSSLTDPPEAFNDRADKADDVPHNKWILPDPAAVCSPRTHTPLARGVIEIFFICYLLYILSVKVPSSPKSHLARCVK